jgi:hypothetical protein
MVAPKSEEASLLEPANAFPPSSFAHPILFAARVWIAQRDAITQVAKNGQRNAASVWTAFKAIVVKNCIARLLPEDSGSTVGR